MDYIKYLRGMVGHNKVILVTASAIIDSGYSILVQKRSDNNQYSLPGGCLEMDEAIEDCLIREVKEETNLEIEITSLIGVYDNFDYEWPNGDKARTINFIYHAKPIGGCLRLDSESKELNYYEYDKIPNMHCIALDNAINDFLGGIKK